ncbi:UNVERIFIED_CONTAM: putative pectinesterase 29, partial [Sesamum indicum]
MQDIGECRNIKPWFDRFHSCTGKSKPRRCRRICVQTMQCDWNREDIPGKSLESLFQSYIFPLVSLGHRCPSRMGCMDLRRP